MCCCETLKREGVNCLCPRYRSQPPGSAGFFIQSYFEYLMFKFEYCPQEHNVVLIRCGRLQDVPNVSTKCIRGKYDLPHVVKKSWFGCFPKCSWYLNSITEFRSMIFRTLLRKPSACSSFHPQSFHFSTTTCQLLLKKPQGQVKLRNNLFKADAIKKVLLCNFSETCLYLLFPSSWRKMGLMQTSV